MIVLDAVCATLAQIAPLRLAESWDNVGLLVGDRSQRIRRILTCLTISKPVVDEALAESAELVVTHHPLPFRPLQRLTSDQVATEQLLRLIRGGTAVYSAHTAFDSAAQGINQLWANALGLVKIRPLVELSDDQKPVPQNLGDHSAGGQRCDADSTLGSGRFGDLPTPMSFRDLVRRAAEIGGSTSPHLVGDADREICRVAVACGSGGSFLAAAKRRGCDAMLTGEATFHTCLEAEALGISLGLLGHYASERFAMEKLAERLSTAFPDLKVWASRREQDPIRPLK